MTRTQELKIKSEVLKFELIQAMIQNGKTIEQAINEIENYSVNKSLKQ